MQANGYHISMNNELGMDGIWNMRDCTEKKCFICEAYDHKMEETGYPKITRTTDYEKLRQLLHRYRDEEQKRPQRIAFFEQQLEEQREKMDRIAKQRPNDNLHQLQQIDEMLQINIRTLEIIEQFVKQIETWYARLLPSTTTTESSTASTTSLSNNNATINVLAAHSIERQLKGKIVRQKQHMLMQATQLIKQLWRLKLNLPDDEIVSAPIDKLTMAVANYLNNSGTS